MSNNNGQRLAGKTAVITGGATGIGLASDEGSVNDIVLFFDSRLESRRPVVIIS
jgi:hypothetical protein